MVKKTMNHAAHLLRRFAARSILICTLFSTVTSCLAWPGLTFSLASSGHGASGTVNPLLLLFLIGGSKNSSCPTGTSGTVATLAGTGSPTGSYVNGTGTAAGFNNPQGVAVDSACNVYVADASNNAIRKITSAGIVTTLAGSPTGALGYTDGIGTAALFKNPIGVAVDAAGNVYVAEYGNNVIRKITPAGVVTTFAGLTGGTSGFSNGTGTAASFNGPTGLAFDSSGNILYVADSNNNAIRAIDMSNVAVTTVAGTGTQGYNDGAAASAMFFVPTNVAVDASGNVYVADEYNYVIRKINISAATVATFAGTYNTGGWVDGIGTSAQFNLPTGVAVDASGNIYVADGNGNSAIRKITSGGIVTTVAGTSANGYLDGSDASALFAWPFALTVDSGGHIYVADSGNNAIRIIW